MSRSLFSPPTGDALTRQPNVEANSPQVVFEEIIEEVRWAIDHQPRTLQERIGPSEIGEPCDRALIARMFGLPQPEEPPNFRAWVGTCMHEGFDRVMAGSPLQNLAEGPRYLLESKVTVGTIGGVEITGHCDLFDTLSGTVVDHKSKSYTRMLDHRRHGPGVKYKVQAQLYGLGWVRAGYHVNTVMNVYYPRDGELSDTFYWAEPYDERVALDALDRANRLHALGTVLGPALAMEQFPHCTEEFCRVCGNYRRPYNSPRKVETTLRGLLAAAK